MTRDELASLRYYLEDFHNTTDNYLEATSAPERTVNVAELQQLTRHFDTILKFRTQINFKYGLGTL
jgi:hypothetical protein